MQTLGFRLPIIKGPGDADIFGGRISKFKPHWHSINDGGDIMVIVVMFHKNPLFLLFPIKVLACSMPKMFFVGERTLMMPARAPALRMEMKSLRNHHFLKKAS
jgi:hypothetical protein